jgi:hypothetical protein
MSASDMRTALAYQGDREEPKKAFMAQFPAVDSFAGGKMHYRGLHIGQGSDLKA